MGIKIIAENKKVRHEYHILETLEAGIVLKGSEVKALRNQQITLKDSYISFQGDEAFLQNAHISEYKASSYNNHEPERLRKLLLHRREIENIFKAIREKGMTCVPLKIYFKQGKVKLEVALVKGKQLHDKREALKTRAVNRDLQRTLKRSKK